MIAIGRTYRNEQLTVRSVIRRVFGVKCANDSREVQMFHVGGRRRR